MKNKKSTIELTVPGTGKTQAVLEMAEKLGIKVTDAKLSDPYKGCVAACTQSSEDDAITEGTIYDIIESVSPERGPMPAEDDHRAMAIFFSELLSGGSFIVINDKGRRREISRRFFNVKNDPMSGIPNSR
jgi:hypothetical protein